MTKYYKDGPILAPDQPLTDNERAKNRLECASKTIMDNTSASYDSCINCQRRSGFPVTIQGFFDHIQHPRCQLNQSYAKYIFSAVDHYCFKHSLPMATAAESSLFHHKLLKCLPEGTTPPRGAITLEMLHQLVLTILRWNVCNTRGRMTVKDLADARDDLTWTWILGLRACQMEQLTRGQFYQNVDGDWFVCARKIHDPTAGPNALTAWLEYEVKNECPWYKSLITRVTSLRDPNALICPNWNAERYRRIIKFAASEWKWQDSYDLSFDGPHNLRHGAINHAKILHGMNAAARRGGHKTLAVKSSFSGTTERYAADNDVRHSKHVRRTTVASATSTKAGGSKAIGVMPALKTKKCRKTAKKSPSDKRAQKVPDKPLKHPKRAVRACTKKQ